MPRSDYAILVGISNYPDPGFPPLEGPPRDVERFKAWLIDPQGGDVDPNNIITIVSPPPSPETASAQVSPQFQDFQIAFQQLITGGGSSIKYHSKNRLYLFFSGHGFCEIRNQMPQAALYAANASRLFNWNIAGTLYALWAKEVAVFGEIVLVMDCCRDAEATKMLMNPPLPAINNPGASQAVKLFCAYAAPKGGKAQERPISELNNEVHSLLTHVLLDAFRHAPPDDKGNITGTMIKGYVENAWPSVCGEIPADPPEIYIPPTGDIVFFQRASNRLLQKITLSSWLGGDQMKIDDGNGQLFATIDLPAAGSADMGSATDSTTAIIQWADQTSENVTIAENDGFELSIQLPAGFYRVRLLTGGVEKKEFFEAGGPDVKL